MNWYKKAQHSNQEVYTHPNNDGTNPFGNMVVDVIHVPEDPYHNQKEDKPPKRNYEYLLDERHIVSKRSAVTAINRLAKAVNDLVAARKVLKNAVSSDEYQSLVRLIKSIVVKDNVDDMQQKELVTALSQIERVKEAISNDIMETLPVSYSKLSEYIERWITQQHGVTKMQRRDFKGNTNADGENISNEHYVSLK